MKLGIYGGTFNPPHLGHTGAAKTAAAVLGLDKLFFMPDCLPPHKEMAEDAPGTEHRLEMLRVAVDGMQMKDRVEVSRLEIDRGGKSYTADTVDALSALYPDAELWLLMGSDMFLTLQNWYRAADILKRCRVAAFARSENDTSELLKIQAGYLHCTYGTVCTVISLPDLVDISSTELRRRLAAGESTSEFLAPPVYGFILREGLYGTHADLKHLSDEELRAVSQSMVKAKRIPHILGTECTAVALARRWGDNEEYARRAGILHDCTKYGTMEEQLNLCARYGIVLDNLEQRTLKLLHAKTGAALAEHVFGQPEEVVSAIRWHTTGRANMTKLEKILYLADYIEPNRDFDGVERLRCFAEEDLDKAVAEGLSMTIEEMSQEGYEIHPATMAALESLKG